MSTAVVFAIPLWRRGCSRSLELQAIAAWPQDKVTVCPVMFALGTQHPSLSWATEMRRIAVFQPRQISPPLAYQAQVIREALEDAAVESGQPLPEFMKQLSNADRRQIVAAARAEFIRQVSGT